MSSTARAATLLCLLGLGAAGRAVGGEVDSPALVAAVSGMSCPLCAHNIEKQLNKDSDIQSVEVDLGKGTVTVVYQQIKSDSEKFIRKSIERAGFTVGKIAPRAGAP